MTVEYKKHIAKRLLSLVLITLFFCPAVVWGVTVATQPKITPQAVKLNVPIGETKEVTDFGEYIQLWYNFVIGSVGIMAAVIIMWGGFKWLTSHGNSAMIGDAKDRIFAAITGLVIAFLSFTILALISGTGSGSFLDVGLPNELMKTVSVSTVQNVFTQAGIGTGLKGDALAEFWANPGSGATTQGSTGSGSGSDSSSGFLHLPPSLNEDAFLAHYIENNPDLLVNKPEITEDPAVILESARNAYRQVEQEFPDSNIYFIPNDPTVTFQGEENNDLLLDLQYNDPSLNYGIIEKPIAGRTNQRFLIISPLTEFKLP